MMGVVVKAVGLALLREVEYLGVVDKLSVFGLRFVLEARVEILKAQLAIQVHQGEGLVAVLSLVVPDVVLLQFQPDGHLVTEVSLGSFVLGPECVPDLVLGSLEDAANPVSLEFLGIAGIDHCFYFGVDQHHTTMLGRAVGEGRLLLLIECLMLLLLLGLPQLSLLGLFNNLEVLEGQNVLGLHLAIFAGGVAIFIESVELLELSHEFLLPLGCRDGFDQFLEQLGLVLLFGQVLLDQLLHHSFVLI
jgi:hypothetical protein